MSTSQISSGQMINIQQIVSGLMAIEQRPLTTVKSRISDVNLQISSVSQLKSLVDSAHAAAKAVEDPTMLASKVVASSDMSLVNAKVTDPTLASVGTISFKPVSLSQQQRTTFAGFGSASEAIDSDAFGALTISVPSTSSLLGSDEAAMQVVVQVGGRSLSDVAAEINESLSSKVRASVVKSADEGYVLSLTGVGGGRQAVFETSWDDLTNSKLGENGLRLGDAATGTGFDNQARDATALVDGGILVSSSTNTFSEVIPGLSLEVKALTSGNASNIGNTVTLTVGDSREELKLRLGKFAAAFTSLTQKIRELTAPASADAKGGVLALDSGTLSLSSSLYQAYSTGLTLSGERAWQDSTGATYGTSARPISWARIGLEMARGGVVSLNSTLFDAAINGSLGEALVEGFTSSISTVLSDFKGVSGSLQGAIDTMRTNLSTLRNSQTQQEERLERKRAALVSQYSALDAKLVQMNQMSQNVRSALAGLAV
jgi:flagellar hook-associated protein 2